MLCLVLSLTLSLTHTQIERENTQYILYINVPSLLPFEEIPWVFTYGMRLSDKVALQVRGDSHIT